jgi:cathepsin D
VPGVKSANNLGQGFYIIPCNNIPKTSITFGGKQFDIDSWTLSRGPASEGSSECVGGVAQNAGSNFWIVGYIFMRNVYTVSAC